MISDVLSQAAAEIRNYLELMPKVYADDLPVINAALEAMDRARIELDKKPHTRR